jgi:beta-glucosidase-like glycosyl hydrolase
MNIPMGLRQESNKLQEKFTQNIGEERWVDSLFNSMSPDEKLGQLFVVASYPKQGVQQELQVSNLISQYRVGGVILFQGSPARVAYLTNEFQSKSPKIPLFMSIDGEWGLNMRLDSTVQFPRQLMLGAIRDNAHIYEFGREVAQQCRRLGINVNFAPVVDINNNPNNPVIGDRSFGEDRSNVTAKGYMYMLGMQDNNVLACAKHFPGHGDTDTDSHLDLPIINHPIQRLDSIEMYPFRVLNEKGLPSVMIAHLNIPALDPTPQLPSTLSKKIVTDWLRDKIGFKGLVFTDAMNMKGMTKYYPSGAADVKALIAGVDILLMSESLPNAFISIKAALKKGELTWADIDAKVKRILRAKYRIGLNKYQPIAIQNVTPELNQYGTHSLKRRLIEQAITLVKNKDRLIPFRNIDTFNMACVSIGRGTKTNFQTIADNYMPGIRHINNGADLSPSMINELKRYKVVVASFHNMSRSAAKNFGVSATTVQTLRELNKYTKVVVIVFGSPYSLKFFDDFHWIVESYEDDNVTHEVTAQALFGASRFSGRLPISPSPNLRFGLGEFTQNTRLQRATPEEVGMNSEKLYEIDRLAYQAIDGGGTPGCVVLVAKDNKIVYHKSFGYHTYSKQAATSINDVFDIASITKVAATTVSLMKLHEEGKINIHQFLSDYMPELRGSNKQNLLIKDILIHQAGLQAWIPFYKDYVDKKKIPKSEVFQPKPIGDYTVEVTDNLYMRTAYTDTIFKKIIDSDLRTTLDYKYSDLGLILFTKMVY